MPANTEATGYGEPCAYCNKPRTVVWHYASVDIGTYNGAVVAATTKPNPSGFAFCGTFPCNGATRKGYATVT